ncbi:MAG TPA: diphthamide biosynthesis enzyme Dph2 [Candidatus Methanoperedenaceae archaeon]|nr:diphthamide biosynthesis enzyme Dph2 [Candidatus Methanoperedenaceae archaeon]
MDTFQLDIDCVIEIVKRRGARCVGLQFPEGLKRRAGDVAEAIEKNTGAAVLISGNPCFGACDVDMQLAQMVDIMFHFGHSSMGDQGNVVFIEARSDADPVPAVEKALEFLDSHRIGIITTVQHAHKLDDVRDFLEKRGKVCVTGRGSSRVKYPGQVIGCSFDAARIDCDELLYIGSGLFHPIGAALATGKRVVAADPLTMHVEVVRTDKVIKKRSAVIAKAMDAKSIGIIASTKSGQKRMALARELKLLAEKHNREAAIIVMDLVTPEQLLNFKFDAFVNTACPRIAIDDAGRFHAPMLSPKELEIVLGEREWDITFDEITDTEN